MSFDGIDLNYDGEYDLTDVYTETEILDLGVSNEDEEDEEDDFDSLEFDDDDEF